MRIKLKIIISLLFVVMFSSCVHKDIIEASDVNNNVIVCVDLKNVDTKFDELKSYMVIFYPADENGKVIDSEKPIHHIIQSTLDYEFNLPVGKYKAVLFNNYSGQSEFSNLDDYDNLYVEAISSDRIYDNKAKFVNVPYIPEPEMIVFDKIELVDIVYQDKDNEVNFTPHIVTQKLEVNIKVTNLINSYKYVAEIGRFDKRCNLVAETTSEGGYVMPFTDSNSNIIFDENKKDGLIKANFLTFGLTDLANIEDAHKHYIYVDFLLVDKETHVVKSFDILDPIYSHDGHSVKLTIDVGIDNKDPFDPIVLPEIHGENSDIDAEVGDWGEETDIEIVF
ncbi:MAG: DUF5119 domain-containing protein [Bacteroidetes bacterium]|nr:DUF5119 domain-containing protein [Bacteroidota bacterium]